MKKYNLKVLAGYTHWDVSIYASGFSYSTSGCYVFTYDNEIVAAYPIEKTIITSIENVEEE
jgi:hypothetical protein